jgi:uncharacterized cysteine cluster protein YcgN (CxxCxxCC family)
MARKPFWQTKTLGAMTPAEWESLCDGCGLCCLIRFEDEDTGEIIPTRVACKLFDGQLCRCTDYANRKAYVPDCIKLTPGNIEDLMWMPKSCAYRRLHEGRGLADWHPLVSGDPESVHRAGVSIRGQTISEASLADPDDAVDYEAPDLLAERGVD